MLHDGDATDREHPVAAGVAPTAQRTWASPERVARSRPALPVVLTPLTRDGLSLAVGDDAGSA
jgi:hypothetical protein